VTDIGRSHPAERLQHDDPTRLGQPPGTQRGEDRPRVQRERRPQRRAVFRQMPSIRGRVGHQENDDLDAAVPTLQGDPPIQGLQVEQPHLGLDADDRRVESALCIPRAQVARDWQWNFRSPRDARAELIAKALEKASVTCVPDWIAVGVRTGDEFQSDRRAGRRKLGNRDAWQARSLNPPECRLAHANRSRSRSEADPATASGQPNVGSRGSDDSIGLLTPSIESTLSRCHLRSLT